VNSTRLVPGLLVAAAALSLSAAAAPAATTKSGPDLVSRSIKGHPGKLTAGARFIVRIKIRNSGNQKAGGSTLAVYLGRKSHRSESDFRIGSAHVPAIGVHRSKTVKVNAKLPAVKASARSLPAGSYHLIACVNASHKLHERNAANDCGAESGSLKLRIVAPPTSTPAPPAQTTTPAPPAPPTTPPNPATAPAFAISDGIDWGEDQDADGNTVDTGDPIDITLAAGNGLAGQAGYTRTAVADEPVPSGTATTLSPVNHDDGMVAVTLPFKFPFGGIPYDSASVGTNGQLTFGAPAPDYFDHSVPQDSRGVDTVVGEFERGLMPYWSDLDLAAGSVSNPAITETVAPGNASVTFSWHIGDCCPGALPERNFSATLFPDGRFRYDYGTPNDPGSNHPAFIGYSAGNGTMDDFASPTTSVPSSALLYTPNPLRPVLTAAAGTVTATIPRGVSGVTVDTGCSVTKANTGPEDGEVSCDVPALAPGDSVVHHVGWNDSLDDESSSLPARDFSGAYTPGGGSPARDSDEITAGWDFRPQENTDEAVAYTGADPPTEGSPTTFTVQPNTTHGLLNPSVVIGLPADTTLDSIKVDGLSDDDLSCLPPDSGSVTCLLPSGGDFKKLDVTVTPGAGAVGSPLTLTAATHADNGGTDTAGSASSIQSVVAGP
jgi:hypothetical protein